MMPKQFTEKLMAWWALNKRHLPWSNQHDPYKIWLSEIILQQTRVEQGTPYYHKFLSKFPDIQALANASLDDVIKSWEGLGYYSRARNLHETARKIVDEYNSNFPCDYPEILKLKGIGSYTAAAISSFAFNQPYAVVDGNVVRLVSRINGIIAPVDTKSVKENISSFVSQGIKFAKPAEFNQALMDFGAMCCVPKNPDCGICPFQESCIAFTKGLVKEIPYKSKKKPKLTRYFHYFVFKGVDNKIILSKRTADDIWKNMYEFPLLETDDDGEISENKVKQLTDHIIPNINGQYSLSFHCQLRQVLTHRNVVANFYKISLNTVICEINPSYFLVDSQKVSNFAFPKIITSHLEHYFDR